MPMWLPLVVHQLELKPTSCKRGREMKPLSWATVCPDKGPRVPYCRRDTEDGQPSLLHLLGQGLLWGDANNSTSGPCTGVWESQA